MHPLCASRRDGRIVPLSVAMPDAALEDERHGRKAAMRMPADAGGAGEVLRRRVMQQHERVEVGKLLGGEWLPDGERPHLMGRREDDLGNGSEFHDVMTTIRRVKLRDVPRALGLGSASPREYPSTVATFTLPIDGEVRFAQWQHPNETLKVISQDEVTALREFLRPGDVAIDIGAHTGDSTLPIALALGVSGTVFALEPNPYVFKVLAVNAGLNRSKTNIVPL